jgi:ribosomal protein S19E (S16A)
MSQIGRILDPKYMNEIESVAVEILKDSYAAKLNPQAPDFIEISKIGKDKHLAVHILEILGFVEKSKESNDTFLITSKGVEFCDKINAQADALKKQGEQTNLFPENGC